MQIERVHRDNTKKNIEKNVKRVYREKVQRENIRRESIERKLRKENMGGGGYRMEDIVICFQIHLF